MRSINYCERDVTGTARSATAYVIAGLLGGIVLYVVGCFYKIVPLLAWTVRYREQLGKGTAPTTADTFSSRVAHVQLALMASGVTLLAAGSAGASEVAARAGGISFPTGVSLFPSQILRVVRGKPS